LNDSQGKGYLQSGDWSILDRTGELTFYVLKITDCNLPVGLCDAPYFPVNLAQIDFDKTS